LKKKFKDNGRKYDKLACILTNLIIFLITFALTAVLLSCNVFGKIIIAIGSNEEAVRLLGIKVSAYKFNVYAISGLLASVTGIITTARTAVGSPVMGNGKCHVAATF